MTHAPPPRGHRETPSALSLHARAADDLRFIRDTMASAASFTAAALPLPSAWENELLAAGSGGCTWCSAR